MDSKLSCELASGTTLFSKASRTAFETWSMTTFENSSLLDAISLLKFKLSETGVVFEMIVPD